MTGPSRSGNSPGAGDGTVYTITAAASPHSDDLNARMRKYLISMAIRTACVVLAVVVDGWLRWIFIAGAVVLPYVAVLLANARSDRHGTGAPPVTPDLHRQGLGAPQPVRIIYADDPAPSTPGGQRAAS